MFHTTVKCVDCGALMVDVPSNTKRCAVCRVGHNRESVRKANKTRRAEEAVCAAANLGGDTDTNAAITGGLAGAWFGFSAIPARWVDALAPGLRQDLDILAAAAESHRNK